jgi:hypothetical protein
MGRLAINLIGQTFYNLTVLKREENIDEKTGVYWLCKCFCGNEKIIKGNFIKRGSPKSCGCLNNGARIRGGKTRSKDKEMIGVRFGKLLVIERAFSSPNYHVYHYKCLCDCGNYSIVSGTNLRSGASKSCGCYGIEQRSKATIIDITGQKFGKLVVLKRVANRNNRIFYLCKCDCGIEKEISGICLRQGKTISCGCHLIEIRKKEIGQASFTDFYLAYKNSAKSRNIVFDINKELFKKITSSNCYYCGNEPFLEHKRAVFKNGYYKFNGIDRINNNLGYVPSNIVPCCKNCNKAKQTMSEKLFLEYAEKIYCHLLKEGII